jgi:hypothetical protein
MPAFSRSIIAKETNKKAFLRRINSKVLEHDGVDNTDPCHAESVTNTHTLPHQMKTPS